MAKHPFDVLAHLGTNADSSLLPPTPIITPSAPPVPLPEVLTADGKRGPWSGLAWDDLIVGDLIGQGGMGEVYRACQKSVGRVVALKVLEAGSANDPEHRIRFTNEARAAALLQHPNVVAVYASGEHEGRLYMVLEHLPGGTLAELIDARSATHECFSAQEAVELVLQAARGLAAAHACGLVHRDLKPGNLLLTANGSVKIADFGLVRFLAGDALTVSGTVMGTPRYIAPEQGRGLPAQPASDIYSLGAVFYELLTMRPPFDGTTSEELILQHNYREPELPIVLNPEIPAGVQAVCITCMNKDPNRRFASADALVNDLERLSIGMAPLSVAFPAGRISTGADAALRRLAGYRHLWPVLLVALVLVVLSGWWLTLDDRLKLVASWGSPVIAETFADDSWRTRWDCGSDPDFEVRDGRLISLRETTSIIYSRQRFSGPVAIEFDGEITPGSPPCDLSILWFEGDLPPGYKDRPTRGWMLKAGGFDNSFCMIGRRIDNRLDTVARTNRRLIPGQVHRIRAEIDGTRLTLLIDGEVVASFEDLFPVKPGHVGLFAYYPGKAFDNLRVFSKGVSERMVPTALGDDYAQNRQYDDAITRYRRVLDSHPDGPLAQEAWYKIGYCHQMLGQSADAWTAWKHVTAPPYADRVACQDLERLFAAGRHQELLQLLPSVAARSLTAHNQCEGLWVNWAQALLAAKDREQLPGYVTARQQLFAGQGPSVTAFGRVLVFLMRYDTGVAECGDDPIIVPELLLRAGRADEALTRFGYVRHMGGWLRWHAGELAVTLSGSDPSLSPFDLSRALAKVGRTTEALRIENSKQQRELLAAAGDWNALLAMPPDGYCDVLTRLATGRIEEAAAGTHRQPNVLSPLALQLLGRQSAAEVVAEQQKAVIANQATLRLLAELQTGDAGQLQHLCREITATPIDWASESSWFGPLIAVPFLAAKNGDRPAWDAAMNQALSRKNRTGQRLWHLAAFISGQIDEAAMRAQPFSAEAEAWLCLGKGLRAELANQPQQASAAYTSFQQLPLERRLLEEFLPSPVVERFVAWRIMDLGSRR